MRGKYLITCDAWFTAPDGKIYNAVWGDVKIVDDGVLGLKTNRNSSNWFAQVGDDNNHVIVAGCQIHYAIKCADKPNTDGGEAWDADAANGIKTYHRPNSIYIAGSPTVSEVIESADGVFIGEFIDYHGGDSIVDNGRYMIMTNLDRKTEADYLNGNWVFICIGEIGDEYCVGYFDNVKR